MHHNYVQVHINIEYVQSRIVLAGVIRCHSCSKWPLLRSLRTSSPVLPTWLYCITVHWLFFACHAGSTLMPWPRPRLYESSWFYQGALGTLLGRFSPYRPTCAFFEELEKKLSVICAHHGYEIRITYVCASPHCDEFLFIIPQKQLFFIRHIIRSTTVHKAILEGLLLRVFR